MDFAKAGLDDFVDHRVVHAVSTSFDEDSDALVAPEVERFWSNLMAHFGSLRARSKLPERQPAQWAELTG